MKLENEVDIRAAKNLRKRWEAYKKKHRVSQTDFAEDKLGWSQANFSQYLTGHVAIGNKALALFAKALECHVSDIRPELRDQRLDELRELVAIQAEVSKMMNDIVNG